MANTTTQFTIKINGTNQLVELNDLLQTNVRSLGDLKEQQDLLQQAFDQADYGSEAFDELQASLRDVNTQIKVIDQSVEDLTLSEKFEGVSKIVGAVGGAFAFASISIQAFGEENNRTAEELQKLETQISAVIQGQQALQAITEAFGSKNKIVAATINSLSRAFNAAGIAATGWGKVTRIAFISTGIGVFVAAIGTIAANFDKIKEKVAPLVKAFEPFVNLLRDFGSLITGGIISDTATAKFQDGLAKIAKENEKIINKTNENIDKLQQRTTIGVEGRISQLKELIKAEESGIQQLLQNSADSFVETFEEIKAAELDTTFIIGKSYGQIITDFLSGRINLLDAIDQFQNATQDVNADVDTKKVKVLDELIDRYKAVGDELKRTAFTEEEVKNNQDAQLINLKLAKKAFEEANDATKEQLETSEFLNLSLTEQEEILQGIEKTEKAINDDILARQKFLIDIAKQREEEELRLLDIRELNNEFQRTDLDNFRLVNAEVSKIGDSLLDNFGPELAKSLGASNAIDVIIKRIKVLRENINDLGLRSAFDDATLEKIKTFQGLDFGVDAEGQLQVFNIIRDRLKEIQKQEIDINEQRGAKAIKFLTDQRDIINAALDKEKDKAKIQENNIDTQKKVNEINNKTAIQADSINDKYRNITVELQNQETASKNLFKSQQLQVEGLSFEKTIEYLNKFKDGVQLTTFQAEGLSKTFGNITDFTKKITLLPVEEQSKILVQLNEKLTSLYTEQTKKKKETKTEVTEENDLALQLASIITDITNETKSQIDNNNIILKQYQEELDLLTKQSEISLLQRNLRNSPQSEKQYDLQKKSIRDIGKLQDEIIQTNFEKETKGLKDTDERYKIALLKRNDLLIQNKDNTIKSLEEIRVGFINLVAQSYASIVESSVQVFDAVFQAQTEAIDRQISANQIAIDLLSEQIAGIQEQIGFIDEIINQRKQNIDELQAAAESSTAGQREEILKQLDAEVKRTKDLVKEKKALQRQEENAAKAQQKLEKDNQKLALDSIVIQQKAAVAAQILAIAQTGVAIASIAASAAKQDFTFGIATVAAIIAVTAALTANIIGINNALKNVKQAEANREALGPAEGGFASDYEPMAKGGYTPMKGKGRDRTGEDAVGTYMLHSNEYVVPRWMVESAKYGSMVHDMEVARKRGFAEGGSPVPLRQINVDANQEMSLLLRANLNKPVFVAVTDINDGQSRVNVIENRARF